jgi:hypothetical protein
MIFAIVNESHYEHVYISKSGYQAFRCDPANKEARLMSAGFPEIADEWKPCEVRLFEAYNKDSLPQDVRTAISIYYLKIVAYNFITDSDEPPCLPSARDGSWAYSMWKNLQALELKVAGLLLKKRAVIQFSHEHRCWRVSLKMDRVPIAGEAIGIGGWMLVVNFVTHMPVLNACGAIATVIEAPPNDTPTGMSGEAVEAVTEIKDPHDRIKFSMAMRAMEESNVG